MKTFAVLQKVAIGIAALSALSLSALADFSPQTPAFPHGDGIVRENGDCSASTDNKCVSGLSFPSFNNFTDSGQGEGINDERRFLVVRNMGPDGTRVSDYTNTVTAEVGDLIYARAYVHNNGYLNDPTTAATNVTLGMNSFTSAGNNYYYSPAGTSVTLEQFISAGNATPGTVTDDAVIQSSTGQPIKLMYYAQAGASQATGGAGHTIDPVSFIDGGANIGTVQGCSENSFYTWTIFRVVDGTPPEYNLTLEKTVGTTASTATNKSMSAAPGDLLTYKLFYKNELSSTATPVGTKIYDDYDETKLEIVWLPSNPKVCTDDGDRIICDAYDLAPIDGYNEHTFYYTARVKPGVTGTIPNTAYIQPDIDDDSNNDDDDSSAVVTVVTDGVCGDGAITYASDVTAYPAGTEFCEEGDPNPLNPAFPAAGQTVTWTCVGSNGGIDTQCSATKAQQNEYDLKIDKYVGVDTDDANLLKQVVVSEIGGSVTYRLDYQNLSSSTATPTGTKIYDDYDESKLDITWTASVCTDDGDMIICNAADLAPNQQHTIYYVATVKAGAMSPIDNTVEIVPDNDFNPDNNGSGPLNKTPNDEDINDSNDYSSAQIVLQENKDGVCGSAARTYGNDETAYNPNEEFCAEGTSVPVNPAFPAAGQTVNWVCEGVNDGVDVQCSATKAQPQTYDLSLEKYVGAESNSADQKVFTSAIGQSVTYRLDYENLSSSTATPVGTKIYDDYDETKLTITWTDDRCTDDGDMIICDAYDLTSGGAHTFFYEATIRSGATSPINNTVEIVPDNDFNPDNNGSGPLNKTPNDDDINDSNDHSAAQVVIVTPNDGQCGDHNNDGVSDPTYTYSSTATMYPTGFQFCMTGTAVPSQPAFPSAGQTVTWTCQGTSGGGDVSCSATKNLSTPVDVTIGKEVSPDQTQAGDTVTYTLNYANLEAGTTASGVVIKDVIPLHIDVSTIQFSSENDVSCMITQDPDPLVQLLEGQYIECIVNDLTAGISPKPIVYTAQVKPTVLVGTKIDNIAQISTTSNETNAGNNSSMARVTIIENPQGYDLTIEKKVDGVKSKQVSRGQTLTYTLEYQNLTSGTTAQNVTIYDFFDNLELDPSTVQFQQPLPTGVTCDVLYSSDPLLYIIEGEYISCTLDSLSSAEGLQTITYTVQVQDNIVDGTTITNLSEIIPDPDDDTNPSNDTSSASVTVNAPPSDYDLMVEKTVDGVKEKTVSAGSTVTFSLAYKNLDSSSDTATNVILEDDYDETKLQLITPLPTGCTDTAGVLTCQLDDLNVGDSGTVTYNARLISTFTTGETINTVEIIPSPDDDTNPNNDTSSATVLISDDSIKGSCGTAGSEAGKTYGSSVTTYPTGSTFCGNGANPTPSNPAFPAQGQSVTWTCPGSNGGESVSCKATRSSGGSNPPSTPTPTPTSTSSSSSGNSSGSGGGCNTYSVIDLNIAKYVQTSNGSFVSAASRDAALQLSKNQSTNVTYKVVVSNAGDASAYKVNVKDVFSSTSGVSQTNVRTLDGATYSNGVFEFVQPIPANGSREFTYTATVTAGSGGVGSNTARIESMEQSYKCPKIQAERGIGRTAVAYVKAGTVGTAGYILDKQVDKRVVKAGDEVVYTLMIKNTGDIDMKNVILTDRFPSEYLEVEERLKPRLINNRTLEFKRKFLPVGDTFSVSFTMIVREGVPKGTEINNLLTARSDNVSINDSAEAVVIVGESDAVPTCPAGYVWQADLNTCKRKWVPRTPQSGIELPLIPLGITLLGLAFILRRNEIAALLK